jgi:peptidoglycan-N-acetylglucosamine deacetylase
MYLVRTPSVIQALFPGLLWRVPTTRKVLFLTFDDGPVPEVTPWVLDTLRHFGARATFFCVGDNIRKHPELYERIRAEGHATGNHTFNHLNGWKTELRRYLDNVERCAEAADTRLFRPPYGRLTRAQRLSLQDDYRIVMWDVLSGDFDAKVEPERCCRNVVSRAKPGSVIVFHDSVKAERNLRGALPGVLEHFAGLGYGFEALD